ncbi:MAG TPA: winged helix-turn-helix transcriptional regulator [Baekduia sp.]|nr:winged helix-turn-helix transcriptional regulator [Baekduia sp.]
MSAVLTKFQQAQQDVVQRLGELEPLVREYEELKLIAERLQLIPGGSSGGTRRNEPTRRVSSSGGRRQDILRLVAERPGRTINEIGKQLGVDPTGLYRSVRALIAEGQITKRGPNLYPNTTSSLHSVAGAAVKGADAA